MPTTIQPDLLAKAIRIAAVHHETQRDKAGMPYILHPLRMMERAVTVEEKIVAMLHDTVEDTPVTPEMLRTEGFPEELIEAVLLLSKQPEESGRDGYRVFIDRIADAPGRSGELARPVKLLDLADNMDLLRLAELSLHDMDRLGRYHEAYQLLSERVAGSAGRLPVVVPRRVRERPAG